MKKKDVRRSKATRKRGRLVPMMVVLGGIALLGTAALAIFGGGREEYVPEVTGAAALRVDREEENLGDVPLGQGVRVSFEISNVGDRPLRFAGAPYVEVAEGC